MYDRPTLFDVTTRSLLKLHGGIGIAFAVVLLLILSQRNCLPTRVVPVTITPRSKVRHTSCMMLILALCSLLPCLLLFYFQPSNDSVLFSIEHAKVVSIEHPWMQTRHRVYNTMPKHIVITGTDRKNILRRVLRDTVEEVRVHTNGTVRFMLDSGSLLGYIRNRQPLPWDDDHDLSIYYKDLAAFQNDRRVYTRVVEALARRGLKFSLSYENPSCAVCGTSIDIQTGFFIDIFVWRDGLGNFTRGAKWRGAEKGCWRENGGEERSQDKRVLRGSVGQDIGGQDIGGQDMVHVTGDWHMFGWDTVVRKSVLLPPRPIDSFDGVQHLYLPNDPIGVANSEYGNCAQWFQAKYTFVIYAWPNWTNAATIGVLTALVAWLVWTKWRRRRRARGKNDDDDDDDDLAVSKIVITLVFSLVGLGTCCLYLLTNRFRSGFAALSLLIVAIGLLVQFNLFSLSNEACCDAGEETEEREGGEGGKRWIVMLPWILKATIVWSLVPGYPMVQWGLCMLHQEYSMLSCRLPGEETTLQ